MVITIEKKPYNIDNILCINTAYMIMGLYVITIYFKSQEDPLVLEYNEKSEYDKIVNYLKNNLTIH
jgi:hypothetical protein